MPADVIVILENIKMVKLDKPHLLYFQIKIYTQGLGNN